MNKKCTVCQEQFEITEEDKLFYEKLEVPEPTLCPDDRSRRRMAWSSQIHFFNNTCCETGKAVISSYDPAWGIPVMDIEHWWSDNWDMYATGKSFDFNRPFFEQYMEVFNVAPRPNLHRGFGYDENSDYTNYAGKNKNCYLLFDSDKNWDCYYGYSINSGKNVVDCFRVRNSELVYESIDCDSCYGSSFLQNSSNCSNSYFLKNCIGCNDCFGCVNLRNKKYYYLNQKCTKEEYAEKMKNTDIHTYEGLQQFKKDFITFSKQFPHRYMEGIQNENVSGNYLSNCKNAFHCFDSTDLWDCRYITQSFDDAKDSMDCTEIGDAVELFYESSCIGYNGHFVRFSSHALGNISNLDYCFNCPNSSHCFACVGLHNAEYCILNKQYSEEGYKELVPKIIEHMTEKGEFGEFFPAELSPFPYNLSQAYDYYPLSKEEALAKGYTWQDEDETTKFIGKDYEIKEYIQDVKNTICDGILHCEITGKAYKILPQELAFYRNMNLPIPKKCFHQRHRERLDLRNGRNLYERKCESTGEILVTTYSPECSEKIYCEEAYNELCD